jgi:hypothetical protein
VLRIDRDDGDAQTAALERLLSQVDALERRIAKRARKESEVTPINRSQC